MELSRIFARNIVFIAASETVAVCTRLSFFENNVHRYMQVNCNSYVATRWWSLMVVR